MPESNQIEIVRKEIRDLQLLIVRLSELISINQPVKQIGPWVCEKEIQRITGLSRGTLLKLRKSGLISGSKLSGKENFYKYSDFEELLNKNEETI